jgi:hypothetical protein
VSDPNRPSGKFIVCPTHGKRTWWTRKAARAACRRAPGEQLRAYRCDVLPGFHIGHLPQVVREGHLTAAEIYGEAS